MIVVMDIGNTNIVAATHDGVDFTSRVRFDTRADIRPHLEVLKQQGLPERVVISSVVPPVNKSVMESCQTVFGVAPVFVRHDNAGIEIDIDHPEEVGADRLVNAVAALEDQKPPFVIIDFGTATTFDVVDSDGVYQGGVIAPGINLSMAALHAVAAQLPDVPVAATRHVIGKNTKDAMQSGIYYGYLSLIEGVMNRISREMGTRPYVLVTGGLAPLFIKGTQVIDRMDQDLTLKGLVAIDKRLRSKVK